MNGRVSAETSSPVQIEVAIVDARLVKWWWMQSKSNKVHDNVDESLVDPLMHPANFILQGNSEIICGYIATFTMISKSVELQKLFNKSLLQKTTALNNCISQPSNYKAILEDKIENLEFIKQNNLHINRDDDLYKSGLLAINSKLQVDINTHEYQSYIHDDLRKHTQFSRCIQTLFEMSKNVTSIRENDFDKIQSIHFNTHRMLDQLHDLYPEALQWYPYGAALDAQCFYALHLFIVAGVNACDISVVYTDKRSDGTFGGKVFLQKNSPTAKHLYVHKLLFLPIQDSSWVMTDVNTPFHITTSNNELKLGGFVVSSTGKSSHAISGFQSASGEQYLYNGHPNLATAFPCAPYKTDWLTFFNGKKYFIPYGSSRKCGISQEHERLLTDFECMFTYPYEGFFGMGIVEKRVSVDPAGAGVSIDPVSASIVDTDSLKSYMFHFDKYLVENITAILVNSKQSTHVVDTLNAIHKLLSPSLAFFDVQEAARSVSIDWGMLSLRSCIEIIVRYLIMFACDFAVNGILPATDRMLLAAFTAVGNNIYSIHVINDIIYMAATKYQESQTCLRPTLPANVTNKLENFNPSNVNSLAVSNDIGGIVHTIFQATKPIYLPASIANGYVKYHGVSQETVRLGLIYWVENQIENRKKRKDVRDIVKSVVSQVGTIFQGPTIE
jgi:hypothetical protein